MTQISFRKGDVVRCVNDSFIEEQNERTPFTPVRGRLYMVRALTPVLNDPEERFTIFLENLYNPYTIMQSEDSYYRVEPGFWPDRFELVISADNTDWAVQEFYKICLRSK